MPAQRIVAIHLLNDWSGSPLVFRQALEALQKAGFQIEIFTATPSGCGFLSNIPNVTLRELPYRWSPVRVLTLLNYLLAQTRLFFKLLIFLRSTDQVYLNTLLPFGAALAGWLRGCPVVYHVHEVSLKPKLLKTFLRSIANLTAQQVFFVSEYTRQQTALKRPLSHLVYNALPDGFIRQAGRISSPNTDSPFTVLMLCSNKTYKGTDDFVDCARRLSSMRFLLVLNASDADVETFGQRTNPPANCLVFSAQSDTIPFYEQAHVVLNLSHPDGWIETFGMTILEAMACGRPVIIPPVGGICELIEEGREGYRIDVGQPHLLEEALRRLSSDIHLYLQLAEAAQRRARQFSPAAFRRQIVRAFRTGTMRVPVYNGIGFQNLE